MDFTTGWNETALRLVAFLGIFAAMACLEFLIPKRDLRAPRSGRWTTNLAIVILDSGVVRLLALIAKPLVAVGAAIYAEQLGWGLFNNIAWPSWLEILIALVAFDFLIWLQHLASHKVPMLWRVHQMHHADIDIDVSTALRFHPVEIALSMLWKVLWVFILGPAAVAIVLFEVILNGCAMFNHANIALPRWLDGGLRLLIVTPDMHRVHHSTARREHDSNYGFNLSVWDRLFSTYTAQPEKGHLGMTIGLSPYQSMAPTRFLWSLKLPFRGADRGE